MKLQQACQQQGCRPAPCYLHYYHPALVTPLLTCAPPPQVCNQTPPIGGQPSLMTFREVETLFHECGHALQHMLTQARRRVVQ